MAHYLRKVVLAGLAAVSAYGPAEASACGGTFCDSGPRAMPVDQTGENILFVMDGTSVEAHVQIQYQGDAARFAWIVPMPKVPDVTVGSQQLFANLLQGTVPTYGYSNQRDSCGSFASSGGSGGASFGSGGSSGLLIVGDPGVTVVYQKTVGAFEVAVLSGGTADEVSAWLQTNGYASTATAPAILADYVAQGFVFVAVKLTAGAGINEIHPLVFRYAGNEPCVPLKLTAVAATPDMGVRVFFLGDDRVFPTNYKHVVLNPVRIDWNTFATNYNSAITRAADSPLADGHAIITEYAGASRVVNTAGLANPNWIADAYRSLQPEYVIGELQNQGLASCYGGACTFSHPLLLPLLQQYLPAPTGVTVGSFYSCLNCSTGCLPCYALQIDRTAWDANAFADGLKSRIIDPGVHAADLLSKWQYLTRMLTTISPSEMTLDPLFHARPDLSLNTVSLPARATLRTTCSGAQGMILPDSRQVALDGSNWPIFSSLMPWAERIEEVPLTGDIITLADNTATIDEQLALWNKSRNWPPPATASGSGGTGTFGSGGVGLFGFGGARSGAGGTNALPNSAGDPNAEGGCACSVPRPSAHHGLFAAFGFVGIALARRGRRRRLAYSTRSSA